LILKLDILLSRSISVHHDLNENKQTNKA